MVRVCKQPVKKNSRQQPSSSYTPTSPPITRHASSKGATKAKEALNAKRGMKSKKEMKKILDKLDAAFDKISKPMNSDGAWEENLHIEIQVVVPVLSRSELDKYEVVSGYEGEVSGKRKWDLRIKPIIGASIKDIPSLQDHPPKVVLPVKVIRTARKSIYKSSNEMKKLPKKEYLKSLGEMLRESESELSFDDSTKKVKLRRKTSDETSALNKTIIPPKFGKRFTSGFFTSHQAGELSSKDHTEIAKQLNKSSKSSDEMSAANRTSPTLGQENIPPSKKFAKKVVPGGKIAKRAQITPNFTEKQLASFQLDGYSTSTVVKKSKNHHKSSDETSAVNTTSTTSSVGQEGVPSGDQGNVVPKTRLYSFRPKKRFEYSTKRRGPFPLNAASVPDTATTATASPITATPAGHTKKHPLEVDEWFT